MPPGEASLDPAAVTAPAGVEWCRAWTATVDAAISAWLATSEPGGGVAVVALGSYARRELCPRSDIDLLLLHDGWRAADLSRLVRSLCYPLWDAGLSVGHAVHTPREAASAMRDRTETATALTDRRLVAGSPGLADALGDRVSRWLRRNGAGLLEEVAAGSRQRRARDGAHPGMLEPDLKADPGGLRDLHALRWGAACVLGEVGIDPLVGARYLSASERRRLAAAGDVLLAVRCGLHLAHRSATDVLRLDLQDEVAGMLGMADGGELLRRVGIATRTVAHVHGRAFHTLLEHARSGRAATPAPPEHAGDGVTLHRGFIEIDADRDVADEPGLGLRAVAVAARRGTQLGRRTCERLSRALGSGAALAWDDAARADFIATLGCGWDGLPPLRDADQVGLLDALLPEWHHVRGRRQRNPYHRFDLDTHLLVTVAWLHDIARGALSPEAARLMDQLEDPGTLLLGALLHDVGKAWPGDHSEVGQHVARRWLTHMGVDEARQRHVTALIQHHLLLPDAATRRDIDDEHEVIAVAERAGSLEILDGLYLLSLADGRATGPSAHSPWKEGLLATLHARARAVLADDAVGSVVADPAVLAKEARMLAGDDLSAAIDDLIAGVPRRYLLAATPAQCVRHARLLQTWQRTRRPAVAVDAAEAERTTIVSIVAPDRRGLIADCAGLLAAAGVEVVDARAFTRPDAPGEPALALDWFAVDGPPADLPGPLLEDLAQAAAGAVDVEAALASRERRRQPRVSALAETTAVDVRIEHDGRRGRVEVHAQDAPGVLSRLARVLAEAGLDLTGARVATLRPAVRDVFFFRFDGPLDATTLERSLREAAEG